MTSLPSILDTGPDTNLPKLMSARRRRQLGQQSSTGPILGTAVPLALRLMTNMTAEEEDEIDEDMPSDLDDGRKKWN